MKKLFPLILSIVLLAITVSPVLAAGPPEASQLRPGGPIVPSAKDVVLSVDETINVDALGHRHIQKWQRVIDDVIEVKNDYIRKDVDLDTNKTVLYDKQWRDIEFESVEIKPFEPPSGEYYWKKVVLFVDEEDLGLFEDGSSFYTFFDADEYPLVCWEVRYTDGTTVMYDLDGNRIGHGIPAPATNGYLLSGYDYHWYCSWFPWLCDTWVDYRENAYAYYNYGWTDSTTSVFDPANEDISSYVSNPDTKFYYAIAHGNYAHFWATRRGGNEDYYDRYDAYADMTGRDPMVFAFLGHCGAMDETGPTPLNFSDAFRKGGGPFGSGTVTVGYTDMTGSPAWSEAYDWQNMMFYYMNQGEKVYYAWLYATYLDYPEIADYVGFAGDIGLRVN